MATIPRWFVKIFNAFQVVGGFSVTIVSDVPCHLWLFWTVNPPWVHRIATNDRGLLVPWYAYWCYTSWQLIEQNEPGDTLAHTFTWLGWSHCETKYFRFHGDIAGVSSPSDTPIYNEHYYSPPPPLPFYLRPDQDFGVFCGLFPGVGEDHYQDVNEPIPNEDANYVFAGNAYLTDTFGLQDPPAGAAGISSLTVYARCRNHAGGGTPNVRMSLITHATVYHSAVQFMNLNWHDYYWTWWLNPFTFLHWTEQELIDLRVMIRLIGGWPANQGRCTQLYVTVA